MKRPTGRDQKDRDRRGLDLGRRRFVQMVGGTTLLGAMCSRLGWAASSGTPTARFAYVGDEHGIHVYSIAADGRFIKRQTVASANPVAMAISDGHLYVANGVSEYGGRPRGSVEAYAIDTTTRQLKLKNRVPLSLSGIGPRDLAVSPDGRSVVVAVHGGGAYNLLPVYEDGRLGRVSGILKETGSGPHALQACAHPSAVVFDRAGQLLTADQGSDQLSVLALSDGELTVAGRSAVAAGSGPSDMALHSNGKRLYVAHAFNGSVSSFSYDATAGRILDCQQTVRASIAGETAALAIHPSCQMLFSSHGGAIQAWKIANDGSLETLPGIAGVQANQLHVPTDGESILALSNDAVLRIKINQASRALAAPVTVAALSKPVGIATL
jgi:6-phosphogluconolactonase